MRRIHTTHTRDAALRQLNKVNRWLIAGSVVLTGVLADVAANAFPGKTTKATATSKAHKKSSGSASKTSTGVLRAPEQAPKASSEAEPEQQAAPSEPAQEVAPQEAAPAQEAPQEAAPEREAAPEQEAAPAQEAAPEESGPVVSGGS
jgi:small subunit ribosomal protein S16